MPVACLPCEVLTATPTAQDMIVEAAQGGIIRSSVATKYQLGFFFHAGSLIAPSSAATPQGTWESAMNCAFPGSTPVIPGLAV
jgi:hypothetical protein